MNWRNFITHNVRKYAAHFCAAIAFFLALVVMMASILPLFGQFSSFSGFMANLKSLLALIILFTIGGPPVLNIGLISLKVLTISRRLSEKRLLILGYVTGFTVVSLPFIIAPFFLKSGAPAFSLYSYAISGAMILAALSMAGLVFTKILFWNRTAI